MRESHHERRGGQQAFHEIEGIQRRLDVTEVDGGRISREAINQLGAERRQWPRATPMEVAERDLQTNVSAHSLPRRAGPM